MDIPPEQFRKALFEMSVTGEGRDKEVKRMQPLNVLSPIVASWLVGCRVTLFKLVLPENADAAMVVALSENLTDCSLVHPPKQKEGIVVIELLEKSMLPERFTQPFHALAPSERNDIGEKVSTPVPEQFRKAFALISVILEGKDDTSL